MRLASTLVSILKWPMALIVLLLTPATALLSWELLRVAWDAALWLSPFALGFGGMFLAVLLLQRTRFVTLWATIDHEITHAMFAWLTFIPVHQISAGDGSHSRAQLGHVALGGSNWLILIAPYFFPTAPFLVLVLIWTLAAVPTLFAGTVLGMATAWSIVSTYKETHRGQTDLRRVGFGFSTTFLPGANIACYGAILANELGGPDQTLRFFTGIWNMTLGWIGLYLPL